MTDFCQRWKTSHHTSALHNLPSSKIQTCRWICTANAVYIFLEQKCRQFVVWAAIRNGHLYNVVFFLKSVWITRTVCTDLEFWKDDNLPVCRIYFKLHIFKEEKYITFHTIFFFLHYNQETFPFVLFASNYLLQTLIYLTFLFWYAKICCSFSGLIFTTQKSN